MSGKRFRILVCRGPECGDRHNSAAIFRAMREAIAARHLGDRVELSWQSCFGRCTRGPNVLIGEKLPEVAASPRRSLAMPPPRRAKAALYNHVTPGDCAELLDEHIIGGNIVSRLIEPKPI